MLSFFCSLKYIIARLNALQRQEDEHREEVRTKDIASTTDEFRLESAVGKGPVKFGSSGGARAEASAEVEKTFAVYRGKLRELDHWLPELKRHFKELIENSSNKTAISFKSTIFTTCVAPIRPS